MVGGMTADKARALCRADVAAYAGDDPPPLPALYACIDNAPALPDGQLPLVWTKYGHLPAAGLELVSDWHDEPELTVCRVRYLLGDEMVSDSRYVLERQGAGMTAEAGRIGDDGLAPLTMTSH